MSIKPRRSVTLRDVAERAGVHFSTVSRALNPATAPLVSAALAGHIAKIARELRYRPNEAAVHLRTRRSFMINILIANLADPAFPPIIAGVRERLASSRYVAVVGDAARVIGQERHSLEVMKLRPVGGVILGTEKDQDKFISEAASDGLPMVQLLRMSRRRLCSSVTIDYGAGMQTAVDHLRSMGHRFIALISGPAASWAGAAEAIGFVAATERAGLIVTRAQIEPAESCSIEAGARAFERIRLRDQRFTAVVAGNDLLALGAIDAARARGLGCPDDISVVGFDNYPLTARMTPPLTTLQVDYERMGRIAGDLILSRIDESEAPLVHPRLVPWLVGRGSVRPPARR